MSKIGYVYDVQGIGEDGFNDGGIHSFTGSNQYEYLTREILQNSLDAEESDSVMVRIKFKLDSLSVLDYPEFFDLKEIIKECSDYWKDRGDEKCTSFFAEAENKLRQDKIDVLVISDYNTKGATGARNPKHTKSKWRALTSSNGVTENNQGSGGAYGIGKNAPFACSSFRTIFYNTYSKEDNVHAFQGTSKLVTHTHNGQDYKGYGFCWNKEENEPVFENGISPLMDYLNRTEYGTDVVIAGFKKTEDWADVIERATINNFFIAIANKKLTVEIDDRVLDYQNIKSRMEYYAQQEKDLPEKERSIATRLEYYSAFKEPDFELHGNIVDEDDAILYIKKDDNYSKTIAEMRAIGMVVRIRSKNLFARYAAVLTVKPGNLNNILKKIEPPTHDNWDSGLIEDLDERKKIEKIRKKLIKWVNDEIVDKCRGELKEEFDLEGISAYLPFDEDDTSLGMQQSDLTNDEAETSNSPDSDIRTKSVDRMPSIIKKINVSAQKIKGIKDPNIDPHNRENGGSGKGSGGREDINGKDDVTTVMKEGNKIASAPKVVQQRILSTYQAGRYVAIFKLENNCQSLNISIKAVGDDNKNEELNIVSYRVENGSENIINSPSVKLKDLTANKLYKVFLNIEYKERLTLLMNIG